MYYAVNKLVKPFFYVNYIWTQSLYYEQSLLIILDPIKEVSEFGFYKQALLTGLQ